MATFFTNFNNKLPASQDNDCFLVLYKSPVYTLECNGNNTNLELPVTPEIVNKSPSDPWWAQNQYRIKDIIPCDQNLSGSENDGSTLIYDENDPTNIYYLRPDEQKLLTYLYNNDCSTSDSNHPIIQWYNNFKPKISGLVTEGLRPDINFIRPIDTSIINNEIENQEDLFVFDTVIRSRATQIYGTKINVYLPLTNSSITVPLTRYFTTSSKMVMFSSASDLSGSYITVPEFNYNKVLIIDGYGTLSSRVVKPAEEIPVEINSTIIFGTDENILIYASEPNIPAPPSIMSYEVSDTVPVRTILTVLPTPKRPGEDADIGYIFRFNGVNTKPSRIGPIPAENDVPGLLINQFEFDGPLDNQYVTVASVSNNGVGEFSYPIWLGSGCCFVEDGTVIAGTEETCQEYTTDRELSYTYTTGNCPASGSWLYGKTIANPSGSVFYAQKCKFGNYDQWLADFNTGAARNFYKDTSCIYLSQNIDTDIPTTIPTGTNVSVSYDSDTTITFGSISNTGTLYISSDDNSFTFSTIGTTAKPSSFSISVPTSYTPGSELLTLSSDGSIVSVPYVISSGKLICSDTSSTITYYDPEDGFLNQPLIDAGSQGDLIDLSTQTSVKTSVFRFAPSGFGSMVQYGNYQGTQFDVQISAGSYRGYFVNAKGDKGSLSSVASAVSSAIASAAVSSEQTLTVQDVQDNLLPLESVDAILAMLPISFVPDPVFLPCENPFYTRGGFNLNDAFTDECGCYETYIDKGELLYILGTLAALLGTLAALHKILGGLKAGYASLIGQRTAKEADLLSAQTSWAQAKREYADTLNNLTKFVNNYLDRDIFEGSFIETGENGRPIFHFPTGWRKAPGIEPLVRAVMRAWKFEKQMDMAVKRLTGELAKLASKIAAYVMKMAGIEAMIVGISATIGLLQSRLKELSDQPAISQLKQCAPGFSFCEWNGTYEESCGDTKQTDHRYWRRGYRDDGSLQTMPVGWPSCDCCHPCEPCHNPPPDICPVCPEGFPISMGTVLLRDPPLNGDEPCTNHFPICCPAAPAYDPNLTGPFQWDGPGIDVQTGKCVYYRINPDTRMAEFLFFDYAEQRRCCDGDCVAYCAFCDSLE